MSSISLSFNEVSFSPIQRGDGQIWVRASQLAQALGYKSTKSVSNLYAANEDEFTPRMSLVIDSMTNGINGSKRKLKIRIFSLRGCHLIAMFSKTKVAKDFRKWVLDILDAEVSRPETLSTVQTRLPLKDAVNAMVAKTHQTYSDCWRMVHQYMGISSVEELTNKQIPEAVEYVHRVCLSWEAAQNQPKRKCTDGHIIELASLSLELGHWYRFIKPALAILAPEANASMHNVAYELAMSAHNIMYDYGQEEKVKALLQEYEIGGEQHGKLYVDKARMIRELAPA